jgi:hypothetical protein
MSADKMFWTSNKPANEHPIFHAKYESRHSRRPATEPCLSTFYICIYARHSYKEQPNVRLSVSPCFSQTGFVEKKKDENDL